METTISSEQDFEAYEGKFPQDLYMVYFKIVGIGSNTLAKAEHSGPKLCPIVRAQPGFFLMGQNFRAAMHDLVDRFCDIQEDKQ